MYKLTYWNIIIASIIALCCTSIANSQELNTAPDFAYKNWSYDNLVIPYREAIIHGNGDESEPALVIYLHGGPKRGNDNVTHMAEQGIGIIANYLEKQKIKAIMIVPQCPAHLTWGIPTNQMLYALIEYYKSNHNVNPKRIYLLGGSMGGTGTWQMAAEYSDLFAAVMPVAGNPTGVKVQNVYETPIYTVMGLKDNLIPVEPASELINHLKEMECDAVIDIEKSWTHTETCTNSYTDSRLDWLFRHERE